MTADQDGFWYPAVDVAACIGCGLCEKTCPVLAKQQHNQTPKAYAARSRDMQMRLESSSGGVFTACSAPRVKYLCGKTKE